MNDCIPLHQACEKLFADIDGAAERGLSRFGERCARRFTLAGHSFAMECATRELLAADARLSPQC